MRNIQIYLHFYKLSILSYNVLRLNRISHHQQKGFCWFEFLIKLQILIECLPYFTNLANRVINLRKWNSRRKNVCANNFRKELQIDRLPCFGHQAALNLQ